MNPGTLGYGAAALAFTVLTGLLAVAWHGRREGVRMLGACAATVLWAATLAWYGQRDAVPWTMIVGAELLRSGAWLLVLAAIARPVLSKRWRQGAYVAWAACIAVLVIGSISNWSPTPVLTRTGLAMSVLNLLLMEQIYRNASSEGRNVLRLFVLGFGGLMAYDVFLFAQAELLKGISAGLWNARGFLNAAAVPVIALAVKRQPIWSMDVFVSRQFVLYTATFTAVGCYLVAMALGGYWVRVYGGNWGGVAQVLFVVAGGVLLVALVMSDSLRRHAKVFLSKHFYRNKYDYRLEWLRFVQTLSVSDESDVRRVSIQAIAQIFSSPGGVMFAYHADERRFVPVARWPDPLGNDFPDVEENTELVRLLRDRAWIVDLKEERVRVPRTSLGLPAALETNQQIRIISPILQGDRLLGFVALCSPPEPFELTYEDRDLLITVGRHVATHLAQQEADRALAESRQFDAYNRLTAFMMHDLKNSVAQLQLIVTNARRHKHNPEFIDDVIETAANTVERINRLIEQLRNADASRAKPSPLPAMIEAALRRCRFRRPVPVVQGSIPSVEINADPDRLIAIVEHVLRNAQEATPEQGRVELSCEVMGGEVVIAVKDTGSGMDADFLRERLFRPFDSTKGAKGMGVGAYQVREYVRSLGGHVKVQSAPGSGTTFCITLPCYSAAGQTPTAQSLRAAAVAVDRDT